MILQLPSFTHSYIVCTKSFTNYHEGHHLSLSIVLIRRRRRGKPTFDLRLSSSISAAQLSFLERIRKSESPRFGGDSLALGKEALPCEYPKWRTNSLKSRVRLCVVIKVSHNLRISPRVISGRTFNLRIEK